jgi:hypothetical protein
MIGRQSPSLSLSLSQSISSVATHQLVWITSYELLRWSIWALGCEITWLFTDFGAAQGMACMYEYLHLEGEASISGFL